MLLGLIFVVFGPNGFFQFVTPPEHTPIGGAFIDLLVSTVHLLEACHDLARLELAENADKETRDMVNAVNRLTRCFRLTAAVGVKRYVFRQQQFQAF